MEYLIVIAALILTAIIFSFIGFCMGSDPIIPCLGCHCAPTFSVDTFEVANLRHKVAVLETENAILRGCPSHTRYMDYREIVGRVEPSDFNELDEKFDALSEHLKVEYVREKVSDGSVWGDEEAFYCRKKKK